MIQTKTQRKHLYTPLRYPGGKTSLFEFFDQVIQGHDWKDITYIEPYAGGAGAAVSLLILNKVKSIVINDYDPAIYSFWKAIIERGDDFVEKILTTPITIEEWNKQKLIYKKADKDDFLELGFATFFLNRTNRSGILNAGPIGGKEQLGTYKIDARYNREKLIQKIRLIQSRRDDITVTNQDGIAIIEKYASKKGSFFYVDPPYFVKGTDLYLNAFKIKDHEKLAAALNQHSSAKWLLTYDSEPEILDLYRARSYRAFDLKYSAHHNTKSGSELMIFSDVIDVSIIDNL
jgi:DNA adenine methylase